MQKWVVLFAAMTMQLCLGGVYAWSAFVPTLRASAGYTATQTQFVFGSTLAIMCAMALWTGRLYDRFGPRWLTAVSGVATAAAYIGAGCFGHRFPALWFCIAILSSLGIACGYVPSMATAARWFPAREGMASGIVLSGYGASAMALSYCAQALLSRHWQVYDIFRIVGCVYGIAILAASRLVVPPPHDGKTPPERMGLLSSARERRFWALALGVFAATYPGLSFVGNLKPLGLWFSHSERAASAAIMALALGNGLGRVAWGLLYDRIGGRRAVVLCMACVAVSVVFLAAGGTAAFAFVAAAFVFGFCYGGSLAVFPARTAHVYGNRVFGSVYPAVLLIHGLAGIIGAPLEGLAFDRTGSHYPGFAYSLVVILLGIVAYLWLTREASAAGQGKA